MLTTLSSMQPHMSSMPAVSAIEAMRFAAWTPPHFISLMLKIPQARGGSTSASASESSSRVSSAARRSFTASGRVRIESTSSAFIGCSRNSMSSPSVSSTNRETSSAEYP